MPLSFMPVSIIPEYPRGVGASVVAGRFKSMENTIRLSIEGMHCEACARRVTSALAGVDGVHVDSVEVGSAQVKFDAAKTSPDKITAAVDRIGFTARVDGGSGE
jgi:copper chaperone